MGRVVHIYCVGVVERCSWGATMHTVHIVGNGGYWFSIFVLRNTKAMCTYIRSC